MEPFGKLLIYLGIGLAVVGLAVVALPKIPFLGRLPGDIRIERENFTFYFPLATCLLLSAVLSLILWVIRRK